MSPLIRKTVMLKKNLKLGHQKVYSDPYKFSVCLRGIRDRCWGQKSPGSIGLSDCCHLFDGGRGAAGAIEKASPPLGLELKSLTLETYYFECRPCFSHWNMHGIQSPRVQQGASSCRINLLVKLETFLY